VEVRNDPQAEIRRLRLYSRRVNPKTGKRRNLGTSRHAQRPKGTSVLCSTSSATDEAGGRMPTLDGVLETALHVDDLDRAYGFYAQILGLVPLVRDERMCAFAIGDRRCSATACLSSCCGSCSGDRKNTYYRNLTRTPADRHHLAPVGATSAGHTTLPAD
jgi:hypothetical protein